MTLVEKLTELDAFMAVVSGGLDAEVASIEDSKDAKPALMRFTINSALLYTSLLIISLLFRFRYVLMPYALFADLYGDNHYVLFK